MRLSLNSMRMRSETKARSSQPRERWSTFQERKPDVLPKTSGLYMKRLAKITSGGEVSISRWTNTPLRSIVNEPLIISTRVTMFMSLTDLLAYVVLFISNGPRSPTWLLTRRVIYLPLNLCLVGPKIPHQSQSHMCPSLSRLVHDQQYVAGLHRQARVDLLTFSKLK